MFAGEKSKRKTVLIKAYREYENKVPRVAITSTKDATISSMNIIRYTSSNFSLLARHNTIAQFKSANMVGISKCPFLHF